jgi:hypothetical protein
VGREQRREWEESEERMQGRERWPVEMRDWKASSMNLYALFYLWFLFRGVVVLWFGIF